MKKRLLIFAHYYAPDVASTGQIVQDIAEGIVDEFEVTVVCVVPSYTGLIEEEYKKQPYYFEEMNGVKIIRVRVPEFSKNNKVSRVRNIVAYFMRALCATVKSGNQDYIFSISQPPILGGLLGVIAKWLKRAKFIYNIQDFNPEQVMAVGYSRNAFILKAAMLLDKFSCRHSDLVITVGRDLVETLKNRFNNQMVPNHIMINNWIDEKNIHPLDSQNEGVIRFKQQYGLENGFVIMYSGNIGLYYDLENIIRVIQEFKPGTTSRDGREVAFAFIGEGTLLTDLKRYVKEHDMYNVVFIPYQPKSDLIYSLNAADVHWCVNAKGIRGVSCPSKAYGIMAVGKPIIGVLEQGTEVRTLIDEIGCGKCCEPGEYQGIKEIIQLYLNCVTSELSTMGNLGRIYIERYLTKSISVDKYREAIRGI